MANTPTPTPAPKIDLDKLKAVEARIQSYAGKNGMNPFIWFKKTGLKVIIASLEAKKELSTDQKKIAEELTAAKLDDLKPKIED